MSYSLSIFDIKKNNNNNNKFSNCIYCSNCGGKNHLYKRCSYPKISLGVILFQYDRIKDIIKYLLVKRKDSIGYVEFIRGKYAFNDTKYIKKLIDEMSVNEKKIILRSKFKKLWDNLWLNDNPIYKNDFYKAESKFKKISEGYYVDKTFISIKNLIDDTKTNWIETEWGFPKGRRNFKESDLEAAERELQEETSIERQDYLIINKNNVFRENYKGSNNIKYQHIYYLGKYLKNNIIKIDKNNLEQKKEISDIGFYTLEQCLEKIRPFYKEKKNLLILVDKHIREKQLFNVIDLNKFKMVNKYTLSNSI